MDIETQLQFLNTEITKCDEHKASLLAIKSSLTSAVTVQVASLAPLQTKVIELEGKILEKDSDLVRVEQALGEAVRENEALKAQSVDEADAMI